VQELSQACCNAYEESAFIQMEGHVLSTIGWVLGHPTAEAWLRLASVGYGLEEQRVQHVSRFLMEITLFHRAFVAFKPSDVAVGSLLLARFMLGKQRRVRLSAVFFSARSDNSCSGNTKLKMCFASFICSTRIWENTSTKSLASSSKSTLSPSTRDPALSLVNGTSLATASPFLNLLFFSAATLVHRLCLARLLTRDRLRL